MIYDIKNQIPLGNYRKKYSTKVGICLHVTADTKYNNAVNWFKNPESKVSSHYVIEKNGDVFYCVSSDHVAYHCGVVNAPTAEIYFDNGMMNPNNYLIGIEMVNSGCNSLTKQQYLSLYALIQSCSKMHNFEINTSTIIGHNELDSKGRKYDPIGSYRPKDIVSYLKCLELFTTDNNYWLNNTLYNYEYVRTVMNRFVASNININTFEDTLKFCYEKGIIYDKNYWLNWTNAVDFESVNLIFKRIGSYYT